MHSTFRPRVAGIAIAAALLTPQFAKAQFQPEGFQRPTALPPLGRDPVGTVDTTAVVSNPAVLGFLPGAELRWTGVFQSEQSTLPQQGHAIAFGFPIPFLRLGTALRLDMINPPSASAYASYDLLSWGAGIRLTDSASVGVAWQHSYSESRYLHGFDAWALGYTAHPWEAIGIGLWGRAINAPVTEGGYRLDPSLEIALSIRPFASDALEIGLMNAYFYPKYTADYFTPRASLGVKIPGFGRFRADVTITDPDNRAGYRAWMATGGIAVNFNGSQGGSQFGAGTLVGNALGNDARYKPYANLYFDVALQSYRSSAAVEVPHVALRFLIDDTPNTREHVHLLRKLWHVADYEPSVDAVVLELRDAPAKNLAYAQELRDAVEYLKAHGKRVVCHLDDARGTALYVCSSADRILIHPAGGLRFAGMSTTHFYFKGLLDKLGIKADFVRIGDHKSAPESFMREGPTDVARADTQALLYALNAQLVHGIAAGRHLQVAEVSARIAKGPFVSSEAKQAGFIDQFAYSDQVEDEVGKLLGHRTPIVDDPMATRESAQYGAVRTVAIVYMEGDMIDGKSQTIPLFGNRMVGSTTIGDTLRQLRADPNVGAIVLRVESPGGSALAADTLWREIQLTNVPGGKPVVVSMGGVAASGGYYVATPATHVFANPATITGSIGIFYGKADVAELLHKIGVGTETYKTAPRADAESVFRPYTDEEREELQRKVRQFYEVFLNRVSLGRHLEHDLVDKLGQGRVYTGEQAVKTRLVDELGGMRQALDYARKLAGLPEYAPVIELPVPDSSLIGRLLGIEGVSSKDTLLIPKALLDMARALAPFAVNESDSPFARLEWVIPER
jgi:protease IV